MKKIIYAVALIYGCSVFSVALPVKNDIYAAFPGIANETKKILVSAYKEAQTKGSKSTKQIKAVSFDVELINTSAVINAADNEIDLWNGDFSSPMIVFSRIDNSVSTFDIIVKDIITGEVLFTSHLDPRKLTTFQYVPVVINQENKTSNMWDSYTGAFELDENGDLYPASQVELADPENTPFVYNGVQVNRDMQDGQGLRTHYLHALKTGSYDIFVKATLNNNEEETTYVYNINVTNNLPEEPEVGINDYQSKYFKISSYANNIVVESEYSQKVDVQVLDITGKIVASAKLDNRTVINMSNKAAGVYLVNIKGKNFSFSKKVMVK